MNEILCSPSADSTVVFFLYLYSVSESAFHNNCLNTFFYFLLFRTTLKAGGRKGEIEQRDIKENKYELSFASSCNTMKANHGE